MKKHTKITIFAIAAMMINTSSPAFASYVTGLDSFPTMPSKGISKLNEKTSNSIYPTGIEFKFFFKDLVEKPAPKKGK